MTIDLTREKRLWYGQAARRMNVSAGTIGRWGCDGVLVRTTGERIRLETVMIGGRRATTEEALQRFLDRLNESGDPEPCPPRPTPAQRTRELERNGKQLDAILGTVSEAA